MLAAQFARRFALLSFGFAWGALMTYAGFYLTGRGHGTYVPFALATSPLSLGPLFLGGRFSFWIIIFLVPFWWTLLFGLAAGRAALRWAWLALMVAHYAGAALMIYRTDYAFGMRWRALRGMLHVAPGWLIASLLLYCVGQAVMWHEFGRRRQAVVAPAVSEPSAGAAESSISREDPPGV